jgi:hypothetical protein
MEISEWMQSAGGCTKEGRIVGLGVLLQSRVSKITTMRKDGGSSVEGALRKSRDASELVSVAVLGDREQPRQNDNLNFGGIAPSGLPGVRHEDASNGG